MGKFLNYNSQILTSHFSCGLINTSHNTSVHYPTKIDCGDRWSGWPTLTPGFPEAQYSHTAGRHQSPPVHVPGTAPAARAVQKLAVSPPTRPLPSGVATSVAGHRDSAGGQYGPASGAGITATDRVGPVPWSICISRRRACVSYDSITVRLFIHLARHVSARRDTHNKSRRYFKDYNEL